MADGSKPQEFQTLCLEDVCISGRTSEGDVVEIVTGVSFEARRGEMLGLVGESGSGKSQTALAIMGLLSHGVTITSGSIRLDGHYLEGKRSTGRNKNRQRGLGMVFQNPMSSLNPAYPVGVQVAEAVQYRLPGTSRSEAKRQAVDLLSLVELRNPSMAAAQYPHEMSGGMRQRVVIAMALAGSPAFLIADEPTTALDVTIQAKILDLLVRLQQEMNLGVLLISHDLALVSNHCDRVLVMYAGELVEAGPCVDVLSTPRHPYSAGLLRSVPDVALELGELRPVQGRVPSPGSYSQACRFSDRCEWATELCNSRHPELLSGVRCHRVAELTSQLLLRGSDK
jgi:oligopeptide/dipeptide ABC transporter ATP-binding protein